MAAGIAILLAAAAPGPADWYFVDSASDNQNISFMDQANIHESATGTLTAAMYSVLAEDQADGTAAYRFTVEIDCTGHRSRLVTGEAFDVHQASHGEQRLDADWEAVTKGSQGESVETFVCSHGATRAAGSVSLGSALPFERGRAMLAELRAKDSK